MGHAAERRPSAGIGSLDHLDDGLYRSGAAGAQRVLPPAAARDDQGEADLGAVRGARPQRRRLRQPLLVAAAARERVLRPRDLRTEADYVAARARADSGPEPHLPAFRPPAV